MTPKHSVDFLFRVNKVLKTSVATPQTNIDNDNTEDIYDDINYDKNTRVLPGIARRNVWNVCNVSCFLDQLNRV